VSDLENIEKRRLETLFEMGSGYVLNFSNKTFEEFVFDSTGLNIYDNKYEFGSGSKANRLRKFWSVESNQTVAKLLTDLLEYKNEFEIPLEQIKALDTCQRIVERLKQSTPIPELAAITDLATDGDFSILAKAVKQAVESNEPESALDQLHTLMVRFVRGLCSKHSIPIELDKSLSSQFAEYVKWCKGSGRIESEMSERILKSSVGLLGEFNRVRNNHSLAHDNQLLGKGESILICNYIASTVRFIEAIEKQTEAVVTNTSSETEEHELPF